MVGGDYVRSASVPFVIGFVSQSLAACLLNNTTVVQSPDVILLIIFITACLSLSASVGLNITKWRIAIRACPLGTVCAFGLFTVGHVIGSSLYKPFGWYLTVFTAFHFSEYLVTAMYSPRSLNIDSFLLNHSMEYWLAALFSCTEFFIEAKLIPTLKTYTVLSAVGLLLCFIGESLRKGAMITAGTNFTHLIAYQRQRDHQLVTHGVFSLFRHPAYVGWFWWCIGTQLIVCNPISAVAYGVISWRFFRERIEEEELLLLNFFGMDYVQYQRHVPTGLPRIHGYKPDA